MATRTSHLVRPLVALVALVAAMAALLIAYGASPTHAAGSCSTTAGTTTCTFGPTGKEDTFVVPDRVSSVHVVATGAPGAVGKSGRVAGRGARVSGDLKVSPGQKLYVNVGGAPTGSGTSNCSPGVACNGGFNGGGSSEIGGGGGGASDVRTVSRVQSASLASRLIVAAGGGGSGSGVGIFSCTPTALGGSGGDARSDGGDGDPCDSVAGGKGGKAGTQNSGGAGGIPLGRDGSLGQGGGKGGGGGGGGGGYYGGGGGAFILDAPSGGGGGGSNLVPGGGTATLDASGDPSVTISYQVPAESCSTRTGTTTCTFISTGAEDTFEVPDGVSTIHVVATGAPGAVGFLGGSAGRGARVSGNLAVSPGQTLYVNVGGAPTNVSGTCMGGVACVGGFNGGGSSTYGGGGGGASDVRFASREQNNTLFSRLIVAAGGGGSGSGVPQSPPQVDCDPRTDFLLGGAGGDAGSDGGAALAYSREGRCPPIEGTQGSAGTQTAGGAGGIPDGRDGSLGQGGGGGGFPPGFAGGAGGGGLFGGGGGGLGPGGPTEESTGGGGGGSSLVIGSGGTVTISNFGPSVSISYQGGLGSEQRCTLRGTRGSDTLRGTARDDVICGRGGSDALMGHGGEDVLRGGGGPDALVGGPGPDQLLGGAGPDALHAADGVRRNDIMYGGADRDSCRGDRGDVKSSC